MEKIIKVPSRVRFAVADVTPAVEQLPGISIKEAIQETTRTCLLICPNATAKVVKEAGFHPLIAAASLAFNKHYPLVLSPDIIWQTILQGVAQHIQNNAETLRKRLVHHETKIELVLDTKLTGWPQSDAEMLAVTRDFAAKIANHTPADKRFLFGTEFSTTTDVDRIAHSVVLMDAFQPYFEYIIVGICGIPFVTLEGTIEDWQLLKSKVQALHDSNLELSWWTKHLLPLMLHFVRAIEGDVDVSHWRNLCKVIKLYGSQDLNGWILKFIPYVKKGRDEPAIHRNPVLELTTYPDPPTDRATLDRKITGCTSDMLTTGISRVPVVFLDRESGHTSRAEFIAGMVGVTQSTDDLSLRPLIGWGISEAPPIDTLISRLRLEHEVLPPSGMEPWDICNRVFHHHLPADMARFYSETDGAILRPPGSGKKCQILSLSEISKVWDNEKMQKELEQRLKNHEFLLSDYREMKSLYWDCSRLLRIAELDDGTSFVFGPTLDPSASLGSDYQMFHWTGERKPEAFTPIAPTFTDWLTMLLEGGI